MRKTIELHPSEGINWAFLQDEPDFLYRTVADEHRAVLAVGVHQRLEAPVFDARGVARDWYFAALEYEWKDAIDRSGNDAAPAVHSNVPPWFIPRWVIEWAGDRVLLHVDEVDEAGARAWVDGLFKAPVMTSAKGPLEWQVCTDRESYLRHVRKLLDHIQRGDIYEINYCTERIGHAPGFDPFQAFRAMLASSQAPFAGFLRNGDRFALCASPERFLSFRAATVMGQPMKGTKYRSQDPEEDALLAMELATDRKERSENIMALDVMRHDLSRVAASGTVRVVDLCRVVTLPRVHQMISTVSAGLKEGLTPLDALRAAFPMASMTGAPKIRAMQLIAEVEAGRRGLFSGSLGFFAPDGSGDFNVVIRTALYDAQKSTLSIRTGSAITALSDPQREWEECELKARSVIDAIGHAG